MGPADKQDPELLKLGFNPSSAYDVVERIKEGEADLAAQLSADPVWKRRLDDIIEERGRSEMRRDALDGGGSPRLVLVREPDQLGVERAHPQLALGVRLVKLAEPNRDVAA